MEKILKTLDAIKVPSLSGSDANIPGTITSAVVAAGDAVKTKKKERMSHCTAVTDAVCTNNVQSLPDYSKILESVSEVLFQLCNDSDSDIRLVASDCLNKMIRTLKDPHQSRFQMEVYKEIKKNQSPRSLRTALNIFACMSPLIRPQKCRAFMASLLPCFSQISKRTEELLYESMAVSFGEIFKNLGPFANDNEINVLCKDFLRNLESPSAIIRRCSASILVSTCQYSRKPQLFLPKLLSLTSEMLMPNLMETNVPVIIGVLLCIRQCIPPLYEQLQRHSNYEATECDRIASNLIQVYEMCLILCNHDDHNVITTSLETLQQLLTNPVEAVLQRLTSPNGIQNSLDAEKWTSRLNQSQLSLRMNSVSFSDESANLLEGDSDVPNFNNEMSSSTGEGKEPFDIEISIDSRRNSDVIPSENISEADIGSSTEALQQSDDEQTKREHNDKVVLQTFPEIFIGSLYEKNIPIYYCARSLAYNFLLSGQTGHERPDGEVRISVKVLATNCIIHLINFSPEIYNLTLSAKPNEINDGDKLQTIQDLCLYASHNDPLLRGSIYILVGTYIKSALLTSLGQTESLYLQLDDLIVILKEGLQDSSNIGVKCAISGINNCIYLLWRCDKGGKYADELITSLLKTVVNPYWLVKVDLMELLTSLEWDCIPDCGGHQRKVVNVLVDFLGDEDIRVRSTAGSALVKFVESCGRSNRWNLEKAHLFCKSCVLDEVNQCKLDKISDKCVSVSPCSDISKSLETVLNLILPFVGKLDDKYAVAGIYSGLATLSENYPPKIYENIWRLRNHVSDVSLLLNVTVDLLRSSSIVYDLQVHQSILVLACNLFLGSEDFYTNTSSTLKDKHSEEPPHPFIFSNQTVANHGVQLLQHCLAVMKLYQNVIESSSPSVSSRKLSTSPVISPVKKFSQKLEAEKKAQDSEPDKKGKTQMFTSLICPCHFKCIGDSLNQSWKVYKTNLDSVVTLKFTSLLITSLNTLGHLCDLIRSDYHGMVSLIEEILSITSSVFHLCPVPTLKCIRKVLKCLFSSEAGNPKIEKIKSISSVNDPFDKFVYFAETHHKALVQHRRGSIMKTPSEKSALGSYIRQFEPIVITALKMYTTSSDVSIQAEVMKLLSQLIKGHVNYGLVDSNQVFLGFVIKQIGFLEEGQIRNANGMVKEMFQFLILLSHEHQPTKRFIDVPKVLRLCDGLVASHQSSVFNSMCLGVPSLCPVVYDLFVQRSSSSLTNLEKKELEAQREVLLQMLLKLSTNPDVLSIMWILIKGRKATSETKWIEDSKTLMACLVPAVQGGSLVITNRINSNFLVALLVSVHHSSLPPPENILAVLQQSLQTQNECLESFFKWSTIVNSHIVIFIKIFEHNEKLFPLYGLSGSFILDFMYKFIVDLSHFTESCSGSCHFGIQQLKSFLQEIVSFLRPNTFDSLKSELRSDENVDMWMKICENTIKLTIIDPSFRTCIVDILSAVLHPKVKIWDFLLKPSPVLSEEFLASSLTSLMNALNETDVPVLEEWVIVNHSKYLLSQMYHPTVALFINRLSKYRLEQILDQITILLTFEVDVSLTKNILKFFYRICETFSVETAILSLELLKKSHVPFLSFEIAQFSCYIFSHIRIRRLLFSNSDREVLRRFVAIPSMELKHPRLFLTVKKVVNPEVESATYPTFGETPLQQWCCAEISSTDGVALAKMLSSLKYTKIMNIFGQPTFNMSLLQYCFRYLHDLFQTGVISSEEIIDLLTSARRSELMEKWPLGVAVFEFILETLDTWENSVSQNLLTFSDDSSDTILRHLPSSDKLPHMWTALTEMLLLKRSVIKNCVSDQPSFGNNFIPTTLFTVSFQYMRARCQMYSALPDIPLDNLQSFFTFASIALCDSSFLSFFNVRDSSVHIFTCVLSLGCILKNIVSAFNINFNFNQSGSDSYAEMNETCAKVLTEFHYLTEFVFKVRNGTIFLPSNLYQAFTDVVIGLGRCELINGWVLISHLGWKPQAISKSQIFPAVQNIPLEILRDDNDLLLQYIYKLNLFGVASKIQFEENWMTFLSVINSYGDENFQLQIVSTGLKALSMMLEHSITIKYIPDASSEKSLSGLSKIDLVLRVLEPELCQSFHLPPLFSKSTKIMENDFKIDVNSCIRFLTDLFSQWLQNSQGKMPLLLLSDVVHNIVSMSEYFEDDFQYTWMYETLLEIHKSFEKEDEILWPHLIYGIFYAAAKITCEADAMTYLAQILETSLTSSNANVANASVKSALIFLQNHPDGYPVLNVVVPFVIKSTQLSGTINDSECHSCSVWTLLLFIWIYGPSDSISGADFEQETVANILTILIPLNKVYVSVRLLVLKALRAKVELGELSLDTKKKISKMAMDTLKTPNIAIYFESVKLFVAIFYSDFKEVYTANDPDPEALMQMAERSEVLFQQLKSSIKYNCQVISKVLPVIVMDFLPPSEILNRVIAEFMSPIQTSPELLSAVVAQVFEKARRRTKDAALVREWIIASLPNFVSNPDVGRTMWSLTLFFVGVSQNEDYATLLPFAQLRRRSSHIKQLFVHTALDFYSSLEPDQKDEFRRLMSTCKPQGDESLPYCFLIDLIKAFDFENKRWSKEIGPDV